MKNIVVIGGGNMGFTYAEGIFNSQIANIQIIEKFEPRIEEIEAIKKMKVSSSYESIESADIIFLAIKPQIAPEVFKEIKTLINQNQVIISVMAGTTIDTIQNGLGIHKVVRCMPNLPASIQLGMTTYVASQEVSKEELILSDKILNSTGKAFQVANEAMIDNTTGISGSGPAYVFYFMNAMVEKATEIGFNEAQAKELVAQTFKGAVALYESNEISLDAWMDRVASKGGTTRAALDSFDSNDTHNLIKEGITACINRAEELGKM